ncbi:MAG: rod shape-determining protein MreC [Oscillospiraceae bacterium]|nr:rod shape-determining protein MreC [Oscillospiraceae bacterium]
MKALISKKSIVIASVAVLIALSTFVSLNIFGSQGPVTNAANRLSRPLNFVSTQLAQMFEQIYGSIHRYETLIETNERLLRELTDLQLAHREAEALRADNEFLRAYLNLPARREMSNEPATVVRWGGSNFYSSFVINKGYSNYWNSPISVGDGVMTEYGVLVGRVTAVTATTATVTTVLDTSFAAGVFVGDGGQSITARGDFALMGSGYFMLDNIPDGMPVLPGDHVVTSGGVGVFPGGLLMGEVVEVFSHATGLGRYATVRQFRPLDSIHQVFVITEFDDLL